MQSNNFLIYTNRALVFTLLLIQLSVVHAELGATPTPLTTNMPINSIQHSSAQLGSVQVETQIITLPSGTVVVEYIDQGTVFAISWSGPAKPNLEFFLGPIYVDVLRNEFASKSGTFDLHRSSVNGADLVANLSARPHYTEGKIYLKSKLPTGVDPSLI